MPTDKIYYQPSAEGYEEVIRKRLEHWESLRKAARKRAPRPPPEPPGRPPKGGGLA